jgi:hypothetical protein
VRDVSLSLRAAALLAIDQAALRAAIVFQIRRGDLSHGAAIYRAAEKANSYI